MAFSVDEEVFFKQNFFSESIAHGARRKKNRVKKKIHENLRKSRLIEHLPVSASLTEDSTL